MSVLSIEKAPEDADDGVDNGDTSVEWEFGNLSRGQLAVRVPELDSTFVLRIFRERERADAIVACSLDVVLRNLRVLKVDLFRHDLISRIRGIGAQDEFAELSAVAELPVYIRLGTNILFLQRPNVSNCPHDPNSGVRLPLEHQVMAKLRSNPRP